MIFLAIPSVIAFRRKFNWRYFPLIQIAKLKLILEGEGARENSFEKNGQWEQILRFILRKNRVLTLFS